MKPGVNLWLRVLIYNRPTRERERDCHVIIRNYYSAAAAAADFLSTKLSDVHAQLFHRMYTVLTYLLS